LDPQRGTKNPLAVVAVGTFRVFSLLAASRRDYLVSLDFAPGVAEFNTSLANMATRYSRIQLLGLLIGRANFAVPQGFDERTYVRAVVDEIRVAQAPLEQATRPVIADVDLAILMKHFEHQSGTRSNWYNWLNALHAFTESSPRWEAFFLGNEAGYQHVVNTIAAGRFAAVTGSITGSSAMKSIGATLKNAGAVVSEVDVSNALEGVVLNQGSAGLLHFELALLHLPLEKSSRVLATIDSRLLDRTEDKLPAGRDHWHYESFEPRALLGALARVHKISGLIEAYAKLRPRAIKACAEAISSNSSPP
jgi:hypothetical protein